MRACNRNRKQDKQPRQIYASNHSKSCHQSLHGNIHGYKLWPQLQLCLNLYITTKCDWCGQKCGCHAVAETSESFILWPQ